MGLPMYRCSEEFPRAISNVLAARPEFKDATIDQVTGSEENTDGIRIIIRRGGAEIHVSVGSEEEESYLFIAGGSMNPFKWRRSKGLFDDIEAALFENGVEAFDPEEHERLEEGSRGNH